MLWLKLKEKELKSSSILYLIHNVALTIVFVREKKTAFNMEALTHIITHVGEE